ncbi:hypothetical protein [Thermodesulfatator atlanticus]|uniref:hypothetical protein n=1 Tax=Thermodesulfatator atlanticus TaxID=501497 RepID=UPI0003B3EAA3|nr:hypothetical protein [Thermodesulfatator atlanticus]
MYIFPTKLENYPVKKAELVKITERKPFTQQKHFKKALPPPTFTLFWENGIKAYQKINEGTLFHRGLIIDKKI